MTMHSYKARSNHFMKGFIRSTCDSLVLYDSYTVNGVGNFHNESGSAVSKSHRMHSDWNPGYCALAPLF
jgi:hypothetical protein